MTVMENTWVMCVVHSGPVSTGLASAQALGAVLFCFVCFFLVTVEVTGLTDPSLGLCTPGSNEGDISAMLGGPHSCGLSAHGVHVYV